MKNINISLALLLTSIFLLRYSTLENFVVVYMIFLLLTFAFSILTFYWDFSMIFEDYQDLSRCKRISISFFLVLLYFELYVFFRVYFQELDPKGNITLIFISQTPLMFLVLAELIRATSGGSIKYLSVFSSLVFMFLFSQKEISSYLTGAAGILLFSNMLFSTELLKYMNTTKFKGEVLSKINKILTDKKDEWKVKINLLFISYSASIAIKNITPICIKTKIINAIMIVLKMGMEKWVIERLIISYCLCMCVIGLYIGLKSVLDGKWLYKTVCKFIDRKYDLLIE